MRIIEIAALSNGAHRNQSPNSLSVIPNGWAIVPDDLSTPNFPFGDLETLMVDGMLTVTKWIPGVVPNSEPEVHEPSQLDIIEAQVTYTAMMTDTLLEV